METVGAGETIVFIPDKALLGVPFACLRRSGHYLIESNPVTIAPSATLFLRALAGAAAGSGAKVPDGGLVVGDPAFERRQFATLPRLAAAAREARDIAGLYPGSRLLLDGDATKREFIADVRRYRWVHFAGHAIVNAKNPLLSMLLLAPTPGADDAGALYAWEIYQLDLRGMHLVVLSGCGTGDAAVRRHHAGVSRYAPGTIIIFAVLGLIAVGAGRAQNYLTNRVGRAEAIKVASGLTVGMEEKTASKLLADHGLTNAVASTTGKPASANNSINWIFCAVGI